MNLIPSGNKKRPAEPHRDREFCCKVLISAGSVHSAIILARGTLSRLNTPDRGMLQNLSDLSIFQKILVPVRL
jgi:hypothetical protein